MNHSEWMTVSKTYLVSPTGLDDVPSTLAPLTVEDFVTESTEPKPGFIVLRVSEYVICAHPKLFKRVLTGKVIDIIQIPVSCHYDYVMTSLDFSYKSLDINTPHYEVFVTNDGKDIEVYPFNMCLLGKP